MRNTAKRTKKLKPLSLLLQSKTKNKKIASKKLEKKSKPAAAVFGEEN
jgi:hypothetical protein